MADKYILTISDDYPERYWLFAEVLSGEDPSIFKQGSIVSEDLKVSFEAAKKVSASRLLTYDFFYSDGPNLISPRLYDLMLEENISGVQYIDASLKVGGICHAGYKVFNVIDKSAAFDLSKSKSEPLISSMPDGPAWFSKIVLDEKKALSSDVVRAEEEKITVIVSSRVKLLFERNKVRGVQFK